MRCIFAKRRRNSTQLLQRWLFEIALHSTKRSLRMRARGNRSTTSVVRWMLTTLFLVAVLCFLLAPDVVEGKKRRKKNEASAKMKGFWRVFKILLGITLAPPLCTFFYYLIRDPVTPHLFMEIWYRFKDHMTSYLGRGSNILGRKLHKS